MLRSYTPADVFTLANASCGTMPIPTSVILVFLLAVLYRLGFVGQRFWWGRWELVDRVFHHFSALFFISGSLMISTIKVPKL